MIEERKANGIHKIILDRRERISISGVLDVISFDEESVCAETDLGTLIIKGQSLHVNSLELGTGQLEIDGEIDSLHYEKNGKPGKNKGSILKNIFK